MTAVNALLLAVIACLLGLLAFFLQRIVATAEDTRTEMATIKRQLTAVQLRLRGVAHLRADVNEIVRRNALVPPRGSHD